MGTTGLQRRVAGSSRTCLARSVGHKDRILFARNGSEVPDLDLRQLEVRVHTENGVRVAETLLKLASEGYTTIGLVALRQSDFGPADEAQRTLQSLHRKLQSRGVVIVNCSQEDLSPIPFVTAQRLARADGIGSLRDAFLRTTPSIIKEHGRSKHARLDETKMVFNLLKHRPPGFMIDVGAHHGSALLPFARAGWRVLAFEPDEKNRAGLEKRLDPSLDVQIDVRAVADAASTGRSFFASPESTGISSLAPFTSTHEETGSVAVTTLKDVCAAREIRNVDFLKIDTEGFDLMVLRGFPWESIHPAFVVCEFEDRKTVPLGYGFHDLAQFLLDRGYHVLVSEWHPVQRYGISHDWCRLARYPCALKTDRAWGNLLAFRTDITDHDLRNAAQAVLAKAAEVGTGRLGRLKVPESIRRPLRLVRSRLRRDPGAS